MVALLVLVVVIAAIAMLGGAIALLFGRCPLLPIPSRLRGLAVLFVGFLVFEGAGAAIASTITTH